MTADTSIESKLREFILENYLFTDDPSALANDASFLERGIIDSTGIMEVIAFLQEEFEVEVQRFREFVKATVLRTLDNQIIRIREMGMIELYQELRKARDAKSK